MYAAIAKGDYPKWDLYIKVLKPSQLANFDYNPLDATKMWLDVKETKVGTMTLNRMPDNFFQETEQSAFSPANIVPGIEPSEDRLLQGRVFSYADTQLYRWEPTTSICQSTAHRLLSTTGIRMVRVIMAIKNRM